ncbi:hypothetical protein BJX70DRAFT_397849 [Aspergillus crustosus]
MPPRKPADNKVTKPKAAPRKRKTPARATSSSATPNNASSAGTPQDTEMTDVDGYPAAPEIVDVEGEPPAWAQNRATLGETIPWFNQMQGGMCAKREVCWGFLIDGDGGSRPYFDDETIITRLGGGATKDAKGELVLTKDQDETCNPLKSFRNSMRLNIPVGIVIGSKYQGLNRRLPHRFNVMGFFRAVDLWSERIDKKIGFKVRFEKLNLSEKGWWAAKGSPQPVPHDQRNFTSEEAACPDCGVVSRRVYNEGWMCLNGDCKENFWKLNGAAPPKDLTYYQNFLDLRQPFDPNCEPHHPLVPDLLSTVDDNDPHFTTSRIAWKGIVCPLCRKCVSRRLWDAWTCRDPHHKIKNDPENQCAFVRTVPMHSVSLRSVIDDVALGPIKQVLPIDARFHPNVLQMTIDDTSFYPYRKITYHLGDVGSVIHFVANGVINSRPGGPNDLFNELQNDALKLKLQRYELDQAVVKGTMNAQFAANFGMPYKFVVGVDSFSFKEAPEPILRILGRLKWATEQAGLTLNEKTRDPNELLALGYMEGQKIGPHDDGEDTLGPTIASISLGAPSTMAIRMKYNYYHGYTKTKNKKKKLIDNDPVIPLCENYQRRRELKDKLDQSMLQLEQTYGEDLDKLEEFKKEAMELYKEEWFDAYSKKPDKAHEAPPAVIKMQLNHGDMMVMHGEGVQKYFEHGVDLSNGGRLRFALTARHVLKDRIDPGQWYKGEHPEAGVPVYDGDQEE